MRTIKSTERPEDSVLPSLFGIADDINAVQREAKQLLLLLKITAEHVHRDDEDLSDALWGLFNNLYDRVNRLGAIELNVAIHDANMRGRESVAKQEANPGSVVPIKPRGRAPKGGAA